MYTSQLACCLQMTVFSGFMAELPHQAHTRQADAQLAECSQVSAAVECGLSMLY